MKQTPHSPGYLYTLLTDFTSKCFKFSHKMNTKVSNQLLKLLCNILQERVQFSLMVTGKQLFPSLLWRCWLGGRKGIRPVTTEWWGAGVVICLEWGADLHTAQLMPLSLTVSCFSKIQIGFTFQVPAHLGSPGKRAVKRVCVCNWQALHGQSSKVTTKTTSSLT